MPIVRVRCDALANEAAELLTDHVECFVVEAFGRQTAGAQLVNEQEPVRCGVAVAQEHLSGWIGGKRLRGFNGIELAGSDELVLAHRHPTQELGEVLGKADPKRQFLDVTIPSARFGTSRPVGHHR